MSTPTVDLLGADGMRIGEASEGEFEGVLRALHAGEWYLTCPLAGFRLDAGATIDDVAGVRIVDAGRVVYAGSTRPLPDTDIGGITVVGVGDDAVVTLAGPDYGWSAIGSRRAYPDPTVEPPWPVSHDERTGVASTVVVEYLRRNLGPDALLDRRWPNVAIQDGLVGPVSTWSARLQRLDRLVARICLDAGIICRPTLELDGTLAITVTARSDLSARVVLSDQTDLVEIVDRTVPSSASWVLTGGRGEAELRTFAVAATTASGRDRVEHYLDRSSLALVDEVAGASATGLSLAAQTRAIRATLAGEAATQLTFREHYDVGDYIAVERGTTRYVAAIESVRVRLNANEYTVTPQLGDAAIDPWTALVRSVADLEASIDDSIT